MITFYAKTTEDRLSLSLEGNFKTLIPEDKLRIVWPEGSVCTESIYDISGFQLGRFHGLLQWMGAGTGTKKVVLLNTDKNPYWGTEKKSPNKFGSFLRWLKDVDRRLNYNRLGSIVVGVVSVFF